MSIAVKEAAIQRRHNLYRDSIVLSNSDPNLHLLGESPSIDWAGEYGGAQEETDNGGEDSEGRDGESQKKRRMKQVVSMIQVEESTIPSIESCAEAPGVTDIPEEDGEVVEKSDAPASPDLNGSPDLSNGSVSKEEEIKAEEQGEKEIPQQVESAAESAPDTEETVTIQPRVEEQPPSNQEVLEEDLPPPPPEEILSAASEMSPDSAPEESPDFPPPPHDDSGFQSPTSEKEEGQGQSTEVLQPGEEQPEATETNVAAAPAAETTTSDSAREQ